ncbi:DNA repair protein XRCC2 [Onthophagus taurus]|uniref:DNA repair protein XRCC2 n=1 Tax=Onthophagus taurus TaxID=166361 RepID=UPI0039BE5279
MTANIESGVQLYARIRENSIPTKLKYPIFENTVDPSDLIEITGDDKAGNALILDFIIQSITPEEYGGNGTNTIFVNTEHQLTIPIFIRGLKSFMKHHKIENETFIDDCMKNLSIINCYSSDKLKFTFMHIERLLLENIEIKLVVIDSMFTYYWMDKPTVGTLTSFQKYCANNINYLLNVIKDLNVVLICKSINKNLKSNYNGSKRNYILNISENGENMYKVEIFEDGVAKNQIQLEVKPFVRLSK